MMLMVGDTASNLARNNTRATYLKCSCLEQIDEGNQLTQVHREKITIKSGEMVFIACTWNAPLLAG